MSKVLHLNLKKKWFDMISSGEKLEEYRQLKPYWFNRFVFLLEKFKRYLNISGTINQYTVDRILKNTITKDMVAFRIYDIIEFKNGYSKNAPTMQVEFKGIEIGDAKPEWSDNWQSEVFVIKLGKILSNKNANT